MVAKCVCVSERWRPLNCVTVAPEILLTRSSADGNLATGTGAARSALIPDLFLFRFFCPSVCPPLWLSAFFTLSLFRFLFIYLFIISLLFSPVSVHTSISLPLILIFPPCPPLSCSFINIDRWFRLGASNMRSDYVPFDIMSIFYQLGCRRKAMKCEQIHVLIHCRNLVEQEGPLPTGWSALYQNINVWNDQQIIEIHISV